MKPRHIEEISAFVTNFSSSWIRIRIHGPKWCWSMRIRIPNTTQHCQTETWCGGGWIRTKRLVAGTVIQHLGHVVLLQPKHNQHQVGAVRSITANMRTLTSQAAADSLPCLGTDRSHHRPERRPSSEFSTSSHSRKDSALWRRQSPRLLHSFPHFPKEILVPYFIAATNTYISRKCYRYLVSGNILIYS